MVTHPAPLRPCLDGGGLPRTVGADHRHTAHLRHGEADVHDGRLVLGGVGEAHVVHALVGVWGSGLGLWGWGDLR